LVFHALFVGSWIYQWTGADPFAFAGALQREWHPSDQDRILPAGRLLISRAGRLASPSTQTNTIADERLTSIVSALNEKRRVIIQSTEPIDGLARDVWRVLPFHVRRRVSVATWAFANANQFDLVALPKLAGVAVGSSDLILRLGDWRIEASPGMLEFENTRF
jgi:hypothetical protein